jgi:hypothetical protein
MQSNFYLSQSGAGSSQRDNGQKECGIYAFGFWFLFFLWATDL